MTAPISPQPRALVALDAPVPKQAPGAKAARFADILDSMRDARSGQSTATFDETGMFGRRESFDQRVKPATIHSPAVEPEATRLADDAPAPPTGQRTPANARDRDRGSKTDAAERGDGARKQSAAQSSPRLGIAAFGSAARILPRNALRAPAAPLKLTASTTRSSTDIHVSLHATDKGSLVIARTGKLAGEERAQLQSAITALLREHGITDARIEIIERAPFTRERDNG